MKTRCEKRLSEGWIWVVHFFVQRCVAEASLGYIHYVYTLCLYVHYVGYRLCLQKKYGYEQKWNSKDTAVISAWTTKTMPQNLAIRSQSPECLLAAILVMWCHFRFCDVTFIWRKSPTSCPSRLLGDDWFTRLDANTGQTQTDSSGLYFRTFEKYLYI